MARSELRAASVSEGHGTAAVVVALRLGPAFRAWRVYEDLCVGLQHAAASIGLSTPRNSWPCTSGS